MPRKRRWRRRNPGGYFDFGQETPRNLAFLQGVLSCGGWATALSGSVFTPETTAVDESHWLDCWERLHSGAEAGATGFESIELELMDTYMAGVVRWLNASGLQTFISCDGHGRRAPYIEVAARDVDRTTNLIGRASDNQLLYDGRHILLANPSARPSSLGRRKDSAPPSRRWPHRRQLLDLAEQLHGLLSRGGRP